MFRFLILAMMLAFVTPALAQTVDPAIETTTTEQAAPDPGDVTAPPDNTWTIPYGSMIDGAAQVIQAGLMTVILGALTYMLRYLPAGWQVLFRLFLTKQAEQLLGRAVEYGINATKGATKGQKLDINVGSAVIANAAEYAMASGWKFLLDWLGGIEGVKQKIYARVDLEPNATPSEAGVQPLRYPLNRG